MSVSWRSAWFTDEFQVIQGFKVRPCFKKQHYQNQNVEAVGKLSGEQVNPSQGCEHKLADRRFKNNYFRIQVVTRAALLVLR